jgi:hypothetical protein
MHSFLEQLIHSVHNRPKKANERVLKKFATRSYCVNLRWDSVGRSIAEGSVVNCSETKYHNWRLVQHTLTWAAKVKGTERAKSLLVELMRYKAFNFHFRFTRHQWWISRATLSHIMWSMSRAEVDQVFRPLHQSAERRDHYVSQQNWAIYLSAEWFIRGYG